MYLVFTSLRKKPIKLKGTDPDMSLLCILSPAGLLNNRKVRGNLPERI